MKTQQSSCPCKLILGNTFSVLGNLKVKWELRVMGRCGEAYSYRFGVWE